MNIAIFALETSADLYAAKIAKHLKTKFTDLHLSGVGGNLLLQEGQEQYLSMRSFQVMGFSDVFKKIFSLTKNFYMLRNILLKQNPACILFVDGPAFSLRLAKSLRKKGYTGKIIQFVAPTVWVHGKKRADDIAKYFDLLLTLYDFEKPYFPKIKTVFVGHPIVEIIDEALQKPDKLSFSKKVLALFPGSRPAEIARNLPKQLDAAKQFLQQYPDFEVAIGCAGKIANVDITVTFVSFEDRFELMQKSTLALAKSGTVTLELAYLQVPTVVNYELTLLNRLMAQYVLKIDTMPFYAMPNILCGKALFYECIKPPNTADVLCDRLVTTYKEKDTKKTDFELLRKRLETDDSPTKRVAEEVCAKIN